jgi:hypothetical protein
MIYPFSPGCRIPFFLVIMAFSAYAFQTFRPAVAWGSQCCTCDCGTFEWEGSCFNRVNRTFTQVDDSDCDENFCKNACKSCDVLFICSLAGPVTLDAQAAGSCTAACEEATVVAISALSAGCSGPSCHIDWETGAEIDNAGFHIWRSETEDGEFEQITVDLIPAEGGPTRGAEYEYGDFDVEPGLTYYYKLEDIDDDGVSTFHGSVSAWAGKVNIRVNDSEGAAQVTAFDTVSVTVQLRSEDDNGAAPGEYWLCCYSPFGWFSYRHTGGWVVGIKPCDVSPQQLTAGLKILDRTLPPGDYIFYFATDDIPDGSPQPKWLDSVSVTVRWWFDNPRWWFDNP